MKIFCFTSVEYSRHCLLYCTEIATMVQLFSLAAICLFEFVCFERLYKYQC